MFYRHVSSMYFYVNTGSYITLNLINLSALRLFAIQFCTKYLWGLFTTTEKNEYIFMYFNLG